MSRSKEFVYFLKKIGVLEVYTRHYTTQSHERDRSPDFVARMDNFETRYGPNCEDIWDFVNRNLIWERAIEGLTVKHCENLKKHFYSLHLEVHGPVISYPGEDFWNTVHEIWSLHCRDGSKFREDIDHKKITVL